ncbi:hypothetical protein BU25DRAFT_296323, partial [Macroventuria anomochaeta]
IDQHWWLKPPRARGEAYNMDDKVFRPLEPRVVRSKGRPKGATTRTLTQSLQANPHAKPRKHRQHEPREPSRHEYSQATQDNALQASPPSQPVCRKRR